MSKLAKMVIDGKEVNVTNIRVAMQVDEDLAAVREEIKAALTRRLGDKLPTPDAIKAALVAIMRDPSIIGQVDVAVGKEHGAIDITMPEALALELRKRMIEDGHRAGWPEPPRKINPDAPLPWLVIGCNSNAVRNVLLTDYGARRTGEATFQVPGGEIRLITRGESLYGSLPGTLFVLWPKGYAHGEIDKAIYIAEARRMRIETLHSGEPEKVNDD